MRTVKQSDLIGAWIPQTNKGMMPFLEAYEDKKIKDYSNSDVNGLVSVLTESAILVNASISEPELKILTKYCLENLKQYSAKDIRLAVMEYVKGSICENLNAYGSLSAILLSRIVTAYEVLRREHIHEARKLKSKFDEEQAKNRKPSESERMFNFLNAVKMAWDCYRSNKQFWDYGNAINRWLLETNRLLITKDTRESASDYANEKKDSKLLEEAQGRLSEHLRSDPKSLFDKYYREYFNIQFFKKYPDFGELKKTIKLKDLETYEKSFDQKESK